VLSTQELVIKLSELFSIALPAASKKFETAGDLFEWVWEACQPRYPKSFGKEWFVDYFAAGWGLKGIKDLGAPEWHIDTPLEILLPRETRKRQWHELEKRLGAELPHLEYPLPAKVVVVILSISAYAFGGLLFLRLLAALPPFLSMLGRIPEGVWLCIWITNLVGYYWLQWRVMRPYEIEFPRFRPTVFTLGFYWRQWALRQDSDYPPRQAALWMLVRQIIAEAAVCPLKMVRRETSLSELGLE
jgi:hypothetical protein